LGCATCRSATVAIAEPWPKKVVGHTETNLESGGAESTPIASATLDIHENLFRV